MEYLWWSEKIDNFFEWDKSFSDLLRMALKNEELPAGIIQVVVTGEGQGRLITHEDMVMEFIGQY